MVPPTFQFHNIRLDNVEYTMDNAPGMVIANDRRLISTKRILEFVFSRAGTVRIADLGCAEGGYAVEFARMGFGSVGIEIRRL